MIPGIIWLNNTCACDSDDTGSGTCDTPTDDGCVSNDGGSD